MAAPPRAGGASSRRAPMPPPLRPPPVASTSALAPAVSPGNWAASRRYAIVVDAGSSGSRMQVYSWRDARVDRAERMRAGNSTRVLPNVEKGTWDGSGDEWQWKVEPGLSSFGTHPQDLGAYLTPLLDHASTLIPEHAIADTPIYVLATAGMRLLPPAQSDAVLRETCRIIQRDTRFKIPRLAGCEQQVAIISGEEEGLLGWIAINYLMDGFHFPTSLPPSASAAATAGLAPQARPKAKSTFGFLDLGGASTQIAFEPAHPDGEELTKVTLRMLDGTDVASNVFVTTFLGYGTNRARERYVSVLEQAHNGTHLGASASLAAFKAAVAVPTSTPQDLPASTRPSDLIRDPCLPDGLTLATGANATLLGTGSWEGCVQSLEPLLDKQALCARPPCLFHGVHVPKIEFSANHFVGVSEYWFSSNDVFGLGGVYDFVSFQKAARDFCSRPWQEIEAKYRAGTEWGAQVDLGRLRMQCFKSAWMTTVLHEGIGLPRLGEPGGAGDGEKHSDDAQEKADAKNLFQSVNDVNGLSVSWTLGKAVLEASRDIPPPPALGSPEAAPIVSDPGPPTWGNKFSPMWHRPGDAVASLPLPPLRAGGHSVSGAAALFALIGTILIAMMLCFIRGRSPRAIKRRTALREMLPPPLGSCMGLFARGSGGDSRRAGRGDYVLANMEEAGDAEHLGDYSDGEAGAGTSSSEEADPKAVRTSHKRQRSRGGVVATLTWPLRRLLFGARATPVGGLTSRHGSPGSSRRKPSSSRFPPRRSTSSPGAGMNMLMRTDSAAALPTLGIVGVGSGGISSASSISRPSSRAGPRVGGLAFTSSAAGSGAASLGMGTPLGSPPLHQRAASPSPFAAAWASSAANDAPSLSATTSGYSSRSVSRAASPAFGLPPPGIGASGSTTPAPLSRNHSTASLTSLATLTPRTAGAFARRVSNSSHAHPGERMFDAAGEEELN